MKLCFIVDFRSPIAINWISYFIEAGHEVHVISSYPCEPGRMAVASLEVVPVAFSQAAGGSASKKNDRTKFSFVPTHQIKGNIMGSLARGIRYWLGPLDIRRQAVKVQSVIKRIRPDVVHAMRIPFEGILAAEAMRNVNIPLLISVWGNDFTLFASRYPFIGRLTRQTMERTDALHPDCRRDLILAKHWGFDSSKPATVLPGSGGVQPSIFYQSDPEKAVLKRWNIPEGVPIILNPRGFRSYVRNDTFFRSIPRVLKQRPDAIFVGLAMLGNPTVEKWVRELSLMKSVRLLPSISRDEVADLFRLADITVSPSVHDGTPNTLLEGMACGAFPIAGDIESVREWIEHGVNGLLCDPKDPEALAQKTICAINDIELRRAAGQHNRRLIAERADYRKVMTKAEEFYKEIIIWTRRIGVL